MADKKSVTKITIFQYYTKKNTKSEKKDYLHILARILDNVSRVTPRYDAIAEVDMKLMTSGIRSRSSTYRDSTD